MTAIAVNSENVLSIVPGTVVRVRNRLWRVDTIHDGVLTATSIDDGCTVQKRFLVSQEKIEIGRAGTSETDRGGRPVNHDLPISNHYFMERFTPYSLVELEMFGVDKSLMPSAKIGSSLFFEQLDKLESAIQEKIPTVELDWWATPFTRKVMIPKRLLKKHVLPDGKYLDNLFRRLGIVFISPENGAPITFRWLTCAPQKQFELWCSTDPISWPLIKCLSTWLSSNENSPHSYLLNLRSTEEWVLYWIRGLQPNESTVLKKRYGLDGKKTNTLHTIGQVMRLTRERIRQVEKRALERLKARVSSEMIEMLIDRETREFVTELVTRHQFQSSMALSRLCTQKLSNVALFLIECLHDSLQQWIKRLADQNARLPPELVSRSFREAQLLKRELDAYAGAPALPYPLEVWARKRNLSIEHLIKHVPIHKDYTVFCDYLISKKKPSLSRRAVLLHHLLAHNRQPTLFCELLNRVQALNPSVSFRTLTRSIFDSLNAYPHLFLELGEYGWFPIGGGATSMDGMSGAEGRLFTQRTEDHSSIRKTLEDYLHKNGPANFTSLRKVLDSKYSEASVGGILMTFPGIFERKAPNIYGLVSQKDFGASEILMNMHQLSIYVMAIHSGIDRRHYPMWNPRMEHAWALWALQQDNKALYSAFLAVMDSDSWPVDERTKELWKRRINKYGYYRLNSPVRHEYSDRLPSIRDLLSLVLVARDRGRKIGWIRVNQTLSKTINDFHAATDLSLLLALNVIEDTSDWQLPHKLTDEADRFIDMTLDALAGNATVPWTSDLGRQYLAIIEHNAANKKYRWLDSNQIYDIVSLLRTVDVKDAHTKRRRHEDKKETVNSYERMAKVLKMKRILRDL